jgi:hypothetical protein
MKKQPPLPHTIASVRARLAMFHVVFVPQRALEDFIGRSFNQVDPALWLAACLDRRPDFFRMKGRERSVLKQNTLFSLTDVLDPASKAQRRLRVRKACAAWRAARKPQAQS